MILVDTSVWVDHLRAGDAALAGLLETGRVLGHPWVVGELSLGTLVRHAEVLGLLRRLPQATVATEQEVAVLVDEVPLRGQGIGYVDAHLVAAARLSGARLWTRDARLRAVAECLDLAWSSRPDS